MTSNILKALADTAKIRVQNSRKLVSPMEMSHLATRMECDTGFPFEKALARDGMQFICEVKRASPSKGVIAEDFPYLDIAREYEAAGAAAISVLTEPSRFLGEGRFLKEISADVSVPCLRKDFIVDEYMIYEAKTLGASAVLLICAILNKDDLARFINIAHRLGMSALCEVRTASEIRMAVEAGARVIGVNNRDLTDFSVNLETSIILRRLVPKHILFVAESGISSREDVEALEKAGVDAVLIGETLMRSDDKKAKLAELRGGA
ncbi:Indole-3-glycerol phosphate synthase [Thermoplasmatales archaeon BRNA1]|nr:Indole-3-glycerol phosphate synthase [Thermoplasmatales archaeon BRNA1]